MVRTALLVCALAATSAFAQRNPDLEKAQKLLAAKKYAEALKAIDAASKKGNLERDSLLTLWESRGLAEASTGKLDKAEESFRSVLQLDPRRDLTGKYTGKVADVVARAKEWFKNNGGIEVGPLDPGAADGKVTQISLFVRNDPLKLISKAKFYVRVDGGPWKPVEAKVVNGAAATDINATTVEWWAELTSEENNQLMFLGSAGKPVKQSAPAPVAVAKVEEKPVVKDEPGKAPGGDAVGGNKETPKETAKVTPKDEDLSKPEVTKSASSGGSALRPVGYVLIGLGVAAVGVGAYFGITYNGMRESIKADLMSGAASTSALYTRDQAAITNGAIANTLFISGGALVVTGALFWFLGRDTGGAGGGVTVAPVVTSNGGAVSVSGSF
ncbi:MAG: hypothetical protein JNM17_35735 [Archangium sp.]|nr:hypothetical protein [Archangium sp.]